MWRWKMYLAKMGNLLRRGRAERELTREITSHLALLEDDFRRRGMAPQEACLAARRAYGSIENAKELHRNERSIVWLEQTLRDLHYACRNLLRNPGFTLVATLTLTLGIGVNATLFSAYNTVALKPLPVASRTFLSEEDKLPGANPVAVISHSFWQRRFHGDPQAAGKIIKVNGISFTVVGVAPEEFTGTSTLPQVPDLWMPLSMQQQLLPGRDWLHEPDNRQVQILARVKESITLKRAQAEADSMIRQFAALSGSVTERFP